ncbi:6-phosphogluconate dehydrogenase, NAD(+)-dependent, decarboxylating [Paenibacillus polymyxa E681]|nr:6-phosphogluconate dehydrogenase, NAD(+)-dependent, decarboxylating [Paenibacillus polymyxa E681]QNV64447.1 6-phosphogluconate dehydrogenase, NAD(+)-dependent, decarboxylating [Paenibacillus polymyxa E681]
MTSELYEWNLPLKDIALIFRGGCIIRAEFLNVVTGQAFRMLTFCKHKGIIWVPILMNEVMQQDPFTQTGSDP